MYFYCHVYVFLLLCMFCSVYSVFIVPTGTLHLPWLRFFRAFSSVVRQMPGYNSQRRGTVRTLPNILDILTIYTSITIAITCIKPMWNILILNCITNSCIWHTYVTWQGTTYEIPEDDTIVSKHVRKVW